MRNWYLTSGKEHSFKGSENSVFKIFGSKRYEVPGCYIKLHSEEFHNVYSSPNIIRNTQLRRIRWIGHAARTWDTTNAYRILKRNPKGKRTLARPMRRQDYILADPWGIRTGGVRWTRLA
jgi:hypothetical protein